MRCSCSLCSSPSSKSRRGSAAGTVAGSIAPVERTCGPVQKSTRSPKSVAGKGLPGLFPDQLHLEMLAPGREIVDRLLLAK